MEVYEAAEILLKAVHDDINGRIIFSDFLEHQTEGYDEKTTAEIQGIYNKAFLVLADEGLCHRGAGVDIIELGQKGIDSHGDFKSYHRKAKTRNFLEKTRRILPIFSFVFVVLGFYITYMKKASNERKARARVAQTKKDSLQRTNSMQRNKGRK